MSEGELPPDFEKFEEQFLLAEEKSRLKVFAEINQGVTIGLYSNLERFRIGTGLESELDGPHQISVDSNWKSSKIEIQFGLNCIPMNGIFNWTQNSNWNRIGMRLDGARPKNWIEMEFDGYQFKFQL